MGLNPHTERNYQIRKVIPTYLRSSVKPACKGRRLTRIRPRKIRRFSVTVAQINACFVIKKASIVNKTVNKECIERTSVWSKTNTPYSCISRSHKHMINRCASYAVRRGRVVCTKKVRLFGTKICLNKYNMFKRVYTTRFSAPGGGYRPWRGRHQVYIKRRLAPVRVVKKIGRKLTGMISYHNIIVVSKTCAIRKIVYPSARCVRTYRHNGVKFCSQFRFYRPTTYCKRRLTWVLEGKNHSGCNIRGIFYGRKYNKVVCPKSEKINDPLRGNSIGCKVVRKV